MNLLLFQTRLGTTLPVLQRQAASGEEIPHAFHRWRQLRGRINDYYQKFKESFDHCERLCGNLRHANRLSVYHCSRLTAGEAEKRLRDFLQFRYSKHNRWLWLDLLAAAPGGALFWLPGPNVFFYYPAVRALGHYLAREGARKAQRVEASFEKEALIDSVQENMDQLENIRETLSTLEERYQVESLERQLNHLKDR
ncbi:MAG: hypothetical protein ACE5JX_12145 [Acidobacteriota bacterium]